MSEARGTEQNAGGRELWTAGSRPGIKLVLMLMPFLFTAQAQQIEWYMQADSTKMRIGEQIQIRLQAVVPNDAEVLWPMVADTLNTLEVIKRSGIDTSAPGSKRVLEERITVTAWDSGYYVIGPLPLVVNGDTTMSDPIFLTVNTVGTLEEEPYDIKDPLDAPKTLGEWLRQLGPWIALGLVLVLIGYWLWKRRGRHLAVAEAKAVKTDPYEQALNELDQLCRNRLWQKGEVKEYYDGLTDIARRYLERGYGIPALESTTDETKELLADQPVRAEVRDDFIALMQEADMVKFARERFNDKACEQALRRTREFIDAVHEAYAFEEKAAAS